jgi:hypothetical protein
MVTGALDLLLGSRDGNARWRSAEHLNWSCGGVHVLDVARPGSADRFLPSPIRVIVDATPDVTAAPVPAERCAARRRLAPRSRAPPLVGPGPQLLARLGLASQRESGWRRQGDGGPWDTSGATARWRP